MFSAKIRSYAEQLYAGQQADGYVELKVGSSSPLLVSRLSLEFVVEIHVFYENYHRDGHGNKVFRDYCTTKWYHRENLDLLGSNAESSRVQLNGGLHRLPWKFKVPTGLPGSARIELPTVIDDSFWGGGNETTGTWLHDPRPSLVEIRYVVRGQVHVPGVDGGYSKKFQTRLQVHSDAKLSVLETVDLLARQHAAPVEIVEQSVSAAPHERHGQGLVLKTFIPKLVLISPLQTFEVRAVVKNLTREQKSLRLTVFVSQEFQLLAQKNNILLVSDTAPRRARTINEIIVGRYPLTVGPGETAVHSIYVTLEEGVVPPSIRHKLATNSQRLGVRLTRAVSSTVPLGRLLQTPVGAPPYLISGRNYPAAHHTHGEIRGGAHPPSLPLGGGVGGASEQPPSSLAMEKSPPPPDYKAAGNGGQEAKKHVGPSDGVVRRQQAADAMVTVTTGIVEWVPDEVSPACVICRTEFGFFTRRHHCRLDGHCICSNCGEKKVVEGLWTEPQWVCTEHE